MNISAALLTLLFVGQVKCLICFIDSKGIPEPKEGEFVDKTNFKTLECNILKHKDQKPCMTRIDPDGIIRRNCSPVMKDVDICEEDRYKNRYCYCNSDLCNGSDQDGSGC